MKTWIDIVFDGPPSHESGRFVEVETHEGKSISFGEWIHRDDGLTALRIPDSKALTTALDACGEALETMLRVYCDYECDSPSHMQARAALEQAKKAIKQT